MDGVPDRGGAGRRDAMAAFWSGAYQPAEGERLGILACGGNVDLNKLAALAE